MPNNFGPNLVGLLPPSALRCRRIVARGLPPPMGLLEDFEQRFDGTDPVFRNPIENIIFWGMCTRSLSSARPLSRCRAADRSPSLSLSQGLRACLWSYI